MKAKKTGTNKQKTWKLVRKFGVTIREIFMCELVSWKIREREREICSQEEPNYEYWNIHFRIISNSKKLGTN